jgi:hypothetical protein
MSYYPGVSYTTSSWVKSNGSTTPAQLPLTLSFKDYYMASYTCNYDIGQLTTSYETITSDLNNVNVIQGRLRLMSYDTVWPYPGSTFLISDTAGGGNNGKWLRMYAGSNFTYDTNTGIKSVNNGMVQNSSLVQSTKLRYSLHNTLNSDYTNSDVLYTYISSFGGTSTNPSSDEDMIHSHSYAHTHSYSHDHEYSIEDTSDEHIINDTKNLLSNNNLIVRTMVNYNGSTLISTHSSRLTTRPNTITLQSHDGTTTEGEFTTSIVAPYVYAHDGITESQTLYTNNSSISISYTGKTLPSTDGGTMKCSGTGNTSNVSNSDGLIITRGPQDGQDPDPFNIEPQYIYLLFIMRIS